MGFGNLIKIRKAEEAAAEAALEAGPKGESSV
jgi:hypothetical protein